MYVIAIIYLFCYLYLLLAIVESRADRDRDLLARVEQENEQLKAELAKQEAGAQSDRGGASW